MPNIIGIDLGTTTTLIATLSQSGDAIIINNAAGEKLTQSAIWFEDANRALIGSEAKMMVGGADNVFVEFKRDMGNERVVHKVFDKELRPRDLSAIVLRQIREQYEAAYGKVDAVIITIPANFTDQARADTIKAAEAAGFKLTADALVNEPTAAAIYYASTSPHKLVGKYLVYDFGGGTFDATILQVDGDDIKVITSMGVQQLGGKDLDEKLSELIARKYEASSGLKFDEKECGLQKHEVEQYKHTLSVRDKVSVALRTPAGIVRLEITREEFNEAISALVAQAEMAVDSALLAAKLSPSDLAGVFLAGGSTRVPALTESLERQLGLKPMAKNVAEAVALGACLYAGIRNKDKLSAGQKQQIAAKKVQDVTPHFFGTIYFDRQKGRRLNETLIAKDVPLPCNVTKSFTRDQYNSEKIHIEITQCSREEEDVAFVNVIWDGYLENLPKVTQTTEIQITYSYDLNGIMKCHVLDVMSGITLDTSLTSSSGAKAGAESKVDVNDFLL
jgi:molecular chaperone DnaK